MPPAPLLDTRPAADFLAGHAPGAAGFALEDLPRRVHELPPAGEALRVTDADPRRAAAAADFLRRRGHAVAAEPWDSATATEPGPSRTRLWRPAAFLAEALDRIRRDGPPAGGGIRRALDVACGSGRDAVYLALHGYDVTAVDLLPDALDRAADLAQRSGVPLRPVAHDLERDPSLPGGPYAVVTVFRYLQRGLFPALRAAIAPGGYMVYETFHEQNRATGRRPQNPAHLLETGELARAFAGFDVLAAEDAAERDGRFFSRLLARRPMAERP